MKFFWRRLVFRLWPCVFTLPTAVATADGVRGSGKLLSVAVGDGWFGVCSFSSKMTKFAFDQKGADGIYPSDFWMWITPFPERHHGTCMICDESNLVLYPMSCWCFLYTLSLLWSIQRLFQMTHRARGWGCPFAGSAKDWRRGKTGLLSLRSWPQASLAPPRRAAGRGQKTRSLSLLACFLLCIYSDRS